MSRIAIVDLLFNWPPDGGARTDIRQVAVGLSREHDVVLFCPDYRLGFPRGRTVEDPGVAVHRVGFRDIEFFPWVVAKRMRFAVERYQPDWVFIADGWYYKPYVMAAMEGLRTVLRFYAHETICPKSHGHFMDRFLRPCERNWLEGWDDFLACVNCAWRWIVKHPGVLHFRIPFVRGLVFLPHYPRLVKHAISSAGTIICYNDYQASKLGRYNANVHMIPSGIDASTFHPEATQSNHRPRNIFMAGRRGDPLKGYDVLFAACASLVQRGYDIRLFVTEGPKRTEGFVTYTGWLDQNGLARLYRQMDICVVPSVWQEPFGIVALEAMASAKPVIVTRVGGLQRIVSDGVDGFIVEPFNVQKLAEKLARLVGDPQLCSSMGEAGRQKVLDNYQWETILERYYRPIFTRTESARARQPTSR